MSEPVPSCQMFPDVSRCFQPLLLHKTDSEELRITGRQKSLHGKSSQTGAVWTVQILQCLVLVNSFIHCSSSPPGLFLNHSLLMRKITFLPSASLPHPNMSLTSSSIYFLWSAFIIFLLSVSYFQHSANTWLTVSFSPHWQFPVGCFPTRSNGCYWAYCVLSNLSFLVFPFFSIEFWPLWRGLPLVAPSQIQLFPSYFESLTLISTFSLFTATFANLSAFSLPGLLEWAGTHINRISFPSSVNPVISQWVISHCVLAAPVLTDDAESLHTSILFALLFSTQSSAEWSSHNSTAYTLK